MPTLLNAEVTDAEWDSLAAGSRNVFATREWLMTWLRHDTSPTDTFTLSSRRPDGTLLALLPLGRHDRGRLRPTLLRPLGPWPVPERPLICTEEDAAQAVRDMTAQLGARPGWDILELDAVPCEQSWTDELPGVTLARKSNRIIDLAGRTWDELLRATDGHLRSEIRRRERRLQERYTVRYRRVEQGSLHADVDLFLKLHWMRWGEQVNVLTPQRTAFLHEFAELAMKREWLALWFLELDGHPVAANLDLRFEGTEVFFMPGMDPAFRRDHVGLALIFHTIREACADSIQEYHFLRGDQPHKDRLPNRDRQVAHLALGGSPTGNVMIRARVAKRLLRRAARSIPTGRSPRPTTTQTASQRQVRQCP